MSGPITRQYGVPNWDDIFGKKDENEKDPKVGRSEDEEGSSNDPSKEKSDDSK